MHWKNKGFFTSLVFHIRKSHTIVLIIGDEGRRQYFSVAAKILRGFSEKSKITYCFIRSKNSSLEKQTVLLAQAATALCNSHCCSFRRNPLNLLWPLSRNTHRRSASCLKAARASKSKWRAVCYITGKRIWKEASRGCSCRCNRWCWWWRSRRKMRGCSEKRV